MWLSYPDTEYIAFREYSKELWTYDGTALSLFGSYTCLIGSDEGASQEDSLYDWDTGKIREEHLLNKILDETPKDFVSEEELRHIWEKMKHNDLSLYSRVSIR